MSALLADVTIREITTEDCDGVCSLINGELGYQDVGERDLAERIAAMGRDENYRAFVAVFRGRVIGFIGTVKQIAFEKKAPVLRVTALAVSSGFQRGGVGGSLLARAEEYAREEGVAAVAMTSSLTREGAHAFYKSCGYFKKSYGFVKDIGSEN